MALDGVTLFLRLKTLQIHVKVSHTVQLLAGFLQSNGGKLEEAESFTCVFAVYPVLESKYSKTSLYRPPINP